ncbi:hypothetical protein [Acinetobacter defluvii]|uniref:hypothetical protein n=1 Tax=Acinetobacter defluvii TaxID=1871111 RepID=UPI003AF85ADB
MNDQEIYQKIGELLWSIMLQGAKIIYFTGKLYSTYRGWGTGFTLKMLLQAHLILSRNLLK